MKLTKGYSPVLDCQVWRVRQTVEGRIYEYSVGIFTSDLFNNRHHIADRVWRARQAVRQEIFNHYLRELSSVRT